MPDVGHVIDCVHHLRLAHEAFVLMLASGNDSGLALNNELRRDDKMTEQGKQAGSVWCEFLLGDIELREEVDDGIDGSD